MNRRRLPAAQASLLFDHARRHADLIFVIVLTLLAAGLRLWHLGSIPWGLHGDEASTGLDARRILDEGSIGPYTASALGQPAGPMYLAAVFLKLFGTGVMTPRLPMVFLGLLTVIVGFYMLRSLFGRPAGYAGGFLLAVGAWLIFYNRSGFTVSAFPFSEVCAILAVWTATRRQRWYWSMLAGVVVGLGIYGYFAYPLFALGLGCWALLDLVLRRPAPLGVPAANLALIGLTALLVALPMQPYIGTAGHAGYLHDRKAFSIFETPDYKAADGPIDRLGVIKDNAAITLKRLVWQKRPDASDGSGEWPALDPITLALAVAGLLLSAYELAHTRDSRYALAPLLILFVSLGPILSIDGTNRRSLGLFVPVIMLVSIAAAALYQELDRIGRRWRPLVAAVAIIALCGVSLGLNVQRYFQDFPTTDNAYFTFGPELTEAALLMQRQPAGTEVYFAADRWSITYETVQFLAPQIHGEDWLSDYASEPTVPIDRTRTALIVLIGNYEDRADSIAGQYPDATRLTGPQVGDHAGYVAFSLPALDSASR